MEEMWEKLKQLISKGRVENNQAPLNDNDWRVYRTIFMSGADSALMLVKKGSDINELLDETADAIVLAGTVVRPH